MKQLCAIDQACDAAQRAAIVNRRTAS